MTGTVTIESGALTEIAQIEEAAPETTIEIKRGAATTTSSTTQWIPPLIPTRQKVKQLFLRGMNNNFKEIGAVEFLVQENPSAMLAFHKSNFSKILNRVNCLFSNSYSCNKKIPSSRVSFFVEAGNYVTERRSIQ